MSDHLRFVLTRGDLIEALREQLDPDFLAKMDKLLAEKRQQRDEQECRK